MAYQQVGTPKFFINDDIICMMDRKSHFIFFKGYYDRLLNLKYNIWNGSDTQITVDTGIDVVLNEWTFIYWRKRVKSIICEVKNLSGQSEISRYGAYNSEDEWTKIQACKDATHPLVSYAGC